jgi:Uma2 family endonuclease
MITGMSVRKFTVKEYYALAKAGILQVGERVELIDGEIVEMAPTGSRHFAAVLALNRLFGRLVGERAFVSVQMPVLLNDKSMPEPDLTLLEPKSDDYRSGLPVPANVFLLIEVADSSLQYDLNTKLPLYAGEGISEYWLVDLVLGRIQVHRNPGPRGYAETALFERGALVSPRLFPDIVIAVDEVIG